MKVVILAGGLGSRLSEETISKPKPLVEIGGKPIIWHIMKHYAAHGFDDFLIALGYKGDMIKQYFAEYATLASDLTVNLAANKIIRHSQEPDEQWNIGLIDTGLHTHTGGRIRRLAPHYNGTFMATYGDGVCDVDLDRLLAFHRGHGKLATLTAVRPPARFGALELSGDTITNFSEKAQTGEGWINGGFFVLEPEVLDYIESDKTDFSGAPLANLAKDGQLMAYRHETFWQCMDTMRDKELLESLWDGGSAPWNNWNIAR
ncbi:MAG: glucose-1-phosphate cytidylyltransferase [Acidimicrobiales bacterium]|nr:glucose-1-phosphate cytidylyltransferase [Acidimicrobiales bacterium]